MLKIINDADLSDYSTYRISGKAEYLAIVNNQDDLIEALNFAKGKGLKVKVIGAGSNILFPDDTLRGLVIVNKSTKIVETSQRTLRVESGVALSRLVSFTASKGLSGLEFLAGIPGTVGGAVYGNAGAYGKGIGDFIEKIIVFTVSGSVSEVSQKGAFFNYRDSIFKKEPTIILAVEIKLEPADSKLIVQNIKKILKEREGKHPKELSCGSYFKNIEASGLPDNSVQKISSWIKYDKVPAAKLIDEAGCKGLTFGGAQVSPVHANFIVNNGRATSAEIKSLAEIIKEKVRLKFGIILEEEVQVLSN